MGKGKIASTVQVGCPPEALRQECASCNKHLWPVSMLWPHHPASSSWGDSTNKGKELGAKKCYFCLRDMISSQRNYAPRVLFSWMSSRGGSYQRLQSSSLVAPGQVSSSTGIVRDTYPSMSRSWDSPKLTSSPIYRAPYPMTPRFWLT